MTTHQVAHSCAIAISALSLLLLMLVGLDLLMPRREVIEPIQTKWRQVYSIKPKYGTRKAVPDKEREFITTPSFTFPVDNRQSFGSYANDSVQVFATPLLGLVREVYLLRQGERKLFKREASLFGNFVFLPLALLFTSIITLVNYKNQDTAINYGSGSLVLLLLLLWMFRDI